MKTKNNKYFLILEKKTALITIFDLNYNETEDYIRKLRIDLKENNIKANILVHKKTLFIFFDFVIIFDSDDDIILFKLRFSETYSFDYILQMKWYSNDLDKIKREIFENSYIVESMP